MQSIIVTKEARKALYSSFEKLVLKSIRHRRKGDWIVWVTQEGYEMLEEKKLDLEDVSDTIIRLAK